MHCTGQKLSQPYCYFMVCSMIFREKEFRTEYDRLGEMRAVFSQATVIALTASAPPSMLPAIKKSLSLKQDCELLVESANRENIFYIVQKAPNSVPETLTGCLRS